jgi:uncharacterized protein with NAD-binding domain and iron-sulfur cluster
LNVAIEHAEKVLDLARAMDPAGRGHTPDQYADLHQRLSFVQKLVEIVGERIHGLGDDLRHWLILANLGVTVAMGVLADGLLFPTKEDLDRANTLDYRAWLQKHGANAATVDSAIVRAMYDTVFAYPDGDQTGPGNVEAGSSVQTQLKLVGYRGSPFWKMRAGTGDVTAAPIFEVLVRRGVKFEFFHRVDKLVPSADGKAIECVNLGRQVTLRNAPYNPLTPCRGLEVWPDRPLYDQIVEGEALKASKIDLEDYWTSWTDRGGAVVLKRGVDFDELVLGISVGALTGICDQLAARNPAWKDMLANVRTVATQSVQLWIDKTDGWPGPADTVVTGYDLTPIDTWLDASDVVPWEDWPAPAPTSMAILCGAMADGPTLPPPTDHGFPAKMKDAVRGNGLAFLQTAAVLWPALYKPDFDWSALTAPANVAGPARYDYQYWVAGINPSDRYVLTETDTSRHRIAPDQSGFDNLSLAGDWTDYGLNLGCFEGAVISGRLAASAVVGETKRLPSVKAAGASPQAASATGTTTNNAPLPLYVDYASTQTLPGPIEFHNATMWSFLLAGDYQQLTALCRSFFDTPSGGRVRFEPLTPWVIMNFADFPEGRFVGNEQRGYSTERELAFSIPGAYSRYDDGGKLAESGFAAFMPYLIVDNSVALMTGREEYGYFKQYGWVDLPGDSKDAAFSVDVFGCKDYAPDALWSRQPLVRLGQTASAAPSPPAAVDLQKAAGQLLEAMFTDIRAGSQIFTDKQSHFCDFLSGKMSQIFLKQFRDIADGTRACYQAIALADYKMLKINSVLPERSYGLQITKLDSSPLARDLGLNDPTSTGIGMKLNIDMRLETGRVLWQG